MMDFPKKKTRMIFLTSLSYMDVAQQEGAKRYFLENKLIKRD